MARLSIWLGNTRHAAMNYKAGVTEVTRDSSKGYTDVNEGMNNFQIHHLYTSVKFIVTTTPLSTFRATAADIIQSDRATHDILVGASDNYAGLVCAADEGIRMSLHPDFAQEMHDAVAAITTSNVNSSTSTTGSARIAHGKCIWAIGYIYKSSQDDAADLAYVSDPANIAFK